jgi:hypothetical protein
MSMSGDQFPVRVLGVSETSSDMRDLLDREMHEVRAAEAVALAATPNDAVGLHSRSCLPDGGPVVA